MPPQFHAPTNEHDRQAQIIADLSRRIRALELAQHGAAWVEMITPVAFGGTQTHLINSGRYRLIDGDVCEVEVGWNVTGNLSGACFIELPYPVRDVDDDTNTNVCIGTGRIIDQFTARYAVDVVTARNLTYAWLETRAPFSVQQVAGGVPMSWANQDGGNATMRYRIAP